MQFQELITRIQDDHPNLELKVGESFSWSKRNNRITYVLPGKKTEQNRYANKLLHELAHALLEHTEYKSDAELLKIESSAWKLAKELCEHYKIRFSPKEQEESLTSYIEWASSRSQCPECNKNGLQTAVTEFLCPNCTHKWKVGKSRFTRTYRQNQAN